MLALDHLIIYVDDLETAAGRLEETYGLASVRGGTHPTLGTANRIVPFGDHYIELLAVVDPPQFARSGLPRPAAPSFLGWMARATDFDERADRLGLGIAPLSREREDGTTLSWRLAGMEVLGTEPCLPVLIDWHLDQPDHHPGRTSVRHRRPITGIAWLELRGDVDRLRRWCGADPSLPLRFTPGPPAITAVGLAAGPEQPEVVLRPPLDL